MVPPLETPRNIPPGKSTTPEGLEKSFLRNIAKMTRLVSNLQLAQGQAWRENRLIMGDYSARLSAENALASEMADRLEVTIKNYLVINYRHFKDTSTSKPPPPGMYG